MASGKLEQAFLEELRKDKVPVSIFLVNGIKLQGHVEAFDDLVVVLQNTIHQMIFKNAISTIVPSRNVAIGSSDDK